jgi:glutamate---cysteine ligase / carboxylate-amine ligase
LIESHWGESTPLSLGVEEEVMILDAETLEPAPAVATLLAEVEGVELPGRLKTELHASVVELNTDVCSDAGMALASVRAMRAAADAAARANGLRIAAAGAHPTAPPESLEIVQEDRYREMLERLGPTARHQGVNGLHVHVGMPDGDASMRVLEAVLPWLPVVLALSANSPFLAGEDNGFASNRGPILAELPRSGAPPAFDSYAAWESHVERLAELRSPADYTSLWWDVRPHPRFGTLEVRMPDQPTAVERTGAFVALVQALCAVALEEDAAPVDGAARSIYQQNRWAAARFGPSAELLTPGLERRAPASELGAELLALVRPAAERLGSAELLDELDPTSCEADRQRAVGVERAAADLVERTVRSA